ncbi:lipopolysaccharide biosynthesis protein [Fulvivirga lutea]|uniref:Oligosaccharide flippase family protein n=1 Tax=Fulvivirga lutea TaxID=2810512 RepID=A0A974WFD1_9BACT|nr:oligosaccharide flippase family protein [Fulvivirga lutea]QSE97186.1 oligosaccharide flippase family protein [Fulvivirga lutea]
MGIVRRTSIRFLTILYIGIVLGYINTVLIFPNILTEEEFGLTRIIFSAAALIAQITQLGTGNILVRFHPHLKEDTKNTTLTLGLFLSFIGVVLSGLVLFFFKDWIIDSYAENAGLFTYYYYLLFPATISLIAYNLFDGYLRVLLKNSFSAFLNSILLRLVWLGIVLLYAFDFFDTDAFINYYVGGQVAVSCVGLICVLMQGNLTIGFDTSPERLQMLKRMVSFGVVTIVSGISLLLIHRIDVLLVGKYLGLAEVAVFAIAMYMSDVILAPAQSIARTSAVLVADAFKSNNMDMVKTLYKKTALNQVLLGGLVFLLIAVNYDSLLSFLPPTYSDSYDVFFLFGLTKVINTGLGVNGAILINSNYYKLDTILSVSLLVISVVLKILFIPVYGLIGAAASTAFAIIAFNIAKYLILRIKMNLSPFSKNYFIICSILVVAFVITFYMPNTNSVWLNIPITSSVFIILTVPGIYFMQLSEDFNALIDNGIDFLKKWV